MENKICQSCPLFNGCNYKNTSEAVRSYCCEWFNRISKFPNASPSVIAFCIESLKKLKDRQPVIYSTTTAQIDPYITRAIEFERLN